MKKLIPLILYPYAYIILMILYIPIAYAAGLQNPDKNGLFFAIIMLVAAIYNIYVIVISIYNAKMQHIGPCTREFLPNPYLHANMESKPYG